MSAESNRHCDSVHRNTVATTAFGPFTAIMDAGDCPKVSDTSRANPAANYDPVTASSAHVLDCWPHSCRSPSARLQNSSVVSLSIEVDGEAVKGVHKLHLRRQHAYIVDTRYDPGLTIPLLASRRVGRHGCLHCVGEWPLCAGACRCRGNGRRELCLQGVGVLYPTLFATMPPLQLTGTDGCLAWGGGEALQWPEESRTRNVHVKVRRTMDCECLRIITLTYWEHSIYKTRKRCPHPPLPSQSHATTRGNTTLVAGAGNRISRTSRLGEASRSSSVILVSIPGASDTFVFTQCHVRLYTTPKSYMHTARSTYQRKRLTAQAGYVGTREWWEIAPTTTRSPGKETHIPVTDITTLQTVQPAWKLEESFTPHRIHKHLKSWGCGGVVVRLLASYLREPGSVPRRVAPGFPHVGILPYDAAGQRVFSGISRFPPLIRRCSILTSLHPHQLSRPRC
ncbi:hypothetical protein PR048_027746 [Dryococelus australis]|uniref:Uncharacterized protein n=1 Tax=Dryococelus australis TaxID=614101 RepID=A0ABQ9GHD7_9NEOP|nr:hypothetical protein PR048_027746 [Dryococelus australis]